MNRKKRSTAARGVLLCLLVSLLMITGCGRSLVITTGFGREEVFRIGNSKCRIAEVRVYLLDLQKENEALFGDAIWEGADSEGLQQAVKDQALSQIMHVKALNRIGVSRNVMLTREEEHFAEEAERMYYEGLSSEEQKYVGLDERNLQRMFREYELAEKTWQSLGDSAEETYNEYLAKTQCDLNTKYWQSVRLRKLEGEPGAPGFALCCREMLAERDRAQQEVPGGDEEEEAEGSAGKNEAQNEAPAGTPVETPAETPAEQKGAEPAAAEGVKQEASPAPGEPAGQEAKPEAAPAEPAGQEAKPAAAPAKPAGQEAKPAAAPAEAPSGASGEKKEAEPAAAEKQKTDSAAAPAAPEKKK